MARLDLSHSIHGEHQGDPLSPLLFVRVTEVLNELVEEADHRHIPTPLSGDTIKYRSSVYADNLVIFLRLQPHDFIYICQVPQLFARASGLDTKLDKCLISPIRWLGRGGCHGPASSVPVPGGAVLLQISGHTFISDQAATLG